MVRRKRKQVADSRMVGRKEHMSVDRDWDIDWLGWLVEQLEKPLAADNKMTDMQARTSVGMGLGIEQLERLGQECIVDNKRTGIEVHM